MKGRVAVAPELASFASGEDPWPDAETLLATPADVTEAEGEVVALIPIVSQPVGRETLTRLPHLRIVVEQPFKLLELIVLNHVVDQQGNKLVNAVELALDRVA